jgi:16S rRNA pseudouridine516 synthase
MTRAAPATLRLDRLLAHATGLSRVQVRAEIRNGAVQVDGETCTDPARHVHPDARVAHAGTAVAAAQPRYFMLNKPAGVVCATTDRNHRTVLDLLKLPNPKGLHVAGRLDLDATGLVLITDDGEWSHHLTSPRHKQPKAYRVDLAEPLSAVAQQQLEAGVQLNGEPRPCAPAGVEVLGAHTLRLTLTEGKYHQVKRMLVAVGNHVEALHRERIGAVFLDPALAPGQFRPLTVAEIAAGMD